MSHARGPSLSEAGSRGRNIFSTSRSGSGSTGEEAHPAEQSTIVKDQPTTSSCVWASDDDDDDARKRASELYGKFTWKIESFSEISKRELRSNVFEVGGHKWYILVYPQGCDVCNHLSLFLCVADYDKLLPGWSHFAQFTIAIVNKDPKKSKYSDTLHRFCKKEHDWGWKKFIELSKVFEGFTVADTLVIKAQVQVIREPMTRPFRCLDPQYRRELVRVYLSNVEGIFRRFMEEKRERLGKLLADRGAWAALRRFWDIAGARARSELGQGSRDVILQAIVKRFVNEKEVTSTLVMDALHSGCKDLANALSPIPAAAAAAAAGGGGGGRGEGPGGSRAETAVADAGAKRRGGAEAQRVGGPGTKAGEEEEAEVRGECFEGGGIASVCLSRSTAAAGGSGRRGGSSPSKAAYSAVTAGPVALDGDSFVVLGDILEYMEAAARQPFPLLPDEDSLPSSSSSSANSSSSSSSSSSGDELGKDAFERDDRKLAAMGRQTLEMFVLAHVFSCNVESAYREAVALRRQEELIREEEEEFEADCMSRQAYKDRATRKKKKAKHRRKAKKDTPSDSAEVLEGPQQGGMVLSESVRACPVDRVGENGTSAKLTVPPPPSAGVSSADIPGHQSSRAAASVSLGQGVKEEEEGMRLSHGEGEGGWRVAGSQEECRDEGSLDSRLVGTRETVNEDEQDGDEEEDKDAETEEYGGGSERAGPRDVSESEAASVSTVADLADRFTALQGDLSGSLPEGLSSSSTQSSSAMLQMLLMQHQQQQSLLIPDSVPAAPAAASAGGYEEDEGSEMSAGGASLTQQMDDDPVGISRWASEDSSALHFSEHQVAAFAAAAAAASAQRGVAGPSSLPTTAASEDVGAIHGWEAASSEAAAAGWHARSVPSSEDGGGRFGGPAPAVGPGSSVWAGLPSHFQDWPAALSAASASAETSGYANAAYSASCDRSMIIATQPGEENWESSDQAAISDNGFSADVHPSPAHSDPSSFDVSQNASGKAEGKVNSWAMQDSSNAEHSSAQYKQCDAPGSRPSGSGSSSVSNSREEEDVEQLLRARVVQLEEKLAAKDALITALKQQLARGACSLCLKASEPECTAHTSGSGSSQQGDLAGSTVAAAVAAVSNSVADPTPHLGSLHLGSLRTMQQESGSGHHTVAEPQRRQQQWRTENVVGGTSQLPPFHQSDDGAPDHGLNASEGATLAAKAGSAAGAAAMAPSVCDTTAPRPVAQSATGESGGLTSAILSARASSLPSLHSVPAENEDRRNTNSSSVARSASATSVPAAPFSSYAPHAAMDTAFHTAPGASNAAAPAFLYPGMPPPSPLHRQQQQAFQASLMQSYSSDSKFLMQQQQMYSQQQQQQAFYLSYLTSSEVSSNTSASASPSPTPTPSQSVSPSSSVKSTSRQGEVGLHPFLAHPSVTVLPTAPEGRSGSQFPAAAEEFPHLSLITDLLQDDSLVGIASCIESTVM